MFKLNNEKEQLIIGLGNPGNRYLNTWHNAGFIFVNTLAKYLQDSGNTCAKKEKDGYIYGSFRDLKLNILKPYTFMNNSGKPVKNFLKYKEIEKEQILLVHDDLDIELGKYKLSLAKSPKQHNGVTSVEKELGYKDFYRLRIGVETRENKYMSGSDYVLSQIPEEKQEILQATIHNIIKEISE